MSHAFPRALVLAVGALPAVVAQVPTVHSQEALIQDARQLARLLEEAHPDPYTGFGGRIAFHRALQEVLGSIPPQGMDATAFHGLLAPFVARIRDGHTSIRPPQIPEHAAQPGLPIQWLPLDGELCVDAAPTQVKVSRGACLVAIQGVPFRTLCERVNRQRGVENLYGTLRHLGRMLQQAQSLRVLLPEWTPGTPLQVSFRQPDDTSCTQAIAPAALDPHPTPMPSAVKGLPDMTHTSLAWSFLDPKGEAAIVRITDCVTYREGAAYALKLGIRDPFVSAFKASEGRAPKDDAELLASFPSALDTFTELARAMKGRGTRTLLVDVRDNNGGSSLVANLLVYVLYGPGGLQKLETGYSIQRYSQLFLDNRTPDALDVINKHASIRLGLGDYDFKEERTFRDPKRDHASWKDLFRELPSLAEELAHPSRAALYAPGSVFALCNAATYSAGFDIALALHRNGARLVGTPSAQAANCFIDSLPFALTRTGLRGAISYQAAYGYPEDAEKGRLLPCDLPLTRARWKATGFDPHAAVLLALEAARSQAH